MSRWWYFYVGKKWIDISMLIDEAWKRGATEISRIDLKATDEGYPLYKKPGFADKVQNYRNMRLIL